MPHEKRRINGLASPDAVTRSARYTRRHPCYGDVVVRRVIVSVACALGVVAVFACGDDQLCDTECVNGRLTQVCCKSGEECPDIADFCDLGNGLCSDGDCSPAGDASADTNVDAGLVCGSSTCNPGEVCVEMQTSGGGCQLPDDGGLCPGNVAPVGGCCMSAAMTYACKPLPATCNGTLACTCATPSLCASTCMCTPFSGTGITCACPTM